LLARSCQGVKNWLIEHVVSSSVRVAKFITESVNAATKDTTGDLRQYFGAVPRQQAAPMDTGDLYSD